MPITVSLSEAKQAMIHILRANLVPMFVGRPASGKSSTAHQIAEEYNLFIIDLRVAGSDPCDFTGFAQINKETGRGSYAPMDTFPLKGDPIPEGYSGWLLLLDEYNSAEPQVLKATYQLLLDFKVGKESLHEKVSIICIGNRIKDNGIVSEIGTALQSRLIHLELSDETFEFIQWAETNDIDHRITAFLKLKPEYVNNFNPDHTDKTFAAERTWEFASRLLKEATLESPLILPLMAGAVSDGVATEFITYTQIYKELPTISEILTYPETVLMPTSPGILFAMTGFVANHLDASNEKQLAKFIARMPMEFQVVCMREIFRRKPEMAEVGAIVDWTIKNAVELH
jgi:hypothetical protein